MPQSCTASSLLALCVSIPGCPGLAVGVGAPQRHPGCQAALSPGDKGRWLMAPSSAAAWALAAPPGRCALQGMPDGIPRRSGSCFGPQFQVNSLALFPFSIPVFLCKHVGKVNSHS